MRDKDKYLRLTNLNLVVFLYCKDQAVVGINPVGKDQKEFVFLNSGLLEELIDLYKFGDRGDDRLRVNVHKHEQARRELLDRLND